MDKIRYDEPENVSFEYMLITLILPFGKSNAIYMSKWMRVCKTWKNETIKYCKKNPFDARVDFDRALITSARTGNLGAVKLLLECSNARTTARNGEAILMAYINEHYDVFRTLLEHPNQDFGKGAYKLIAAMICKKDWRWIEIYLDQLRNQFDTASRDYTLDDNGPDDAKDENERQDMGKQNISMACEMSDIFQRMDEITLNKRKDKLDLLYYTIRYACYRPFFNVFLPENSPYNRSWILQKIGDIFQYFGLNVSLEFKTDYMGFDEESVPILENIRDRITMNIMVDHEGRKIHYIDGMILGLKSGLMDNLAEDRGREIYRTMCRCMDEDMLIKIFDVMVNSEHHSCGLKLFELACKLEMFDLLKHAMKSLSHKFGDALFDNIKKTFQDNRLSWFFSLGIHLPIDQRLKVFSYCCNIKWIPDVVKNHYLDQIIDSFDRKCWLNMGSSVYRFVEMWKAKIPPRIWTKAIVNLPDLSMLYCFVIPHYLDSCELDKDITANFIVKTMLQERRSDFLDLSRKRNKYVKICMMNADKPGFDLRTVFKSHSWDEHTAWLAITITRPRMLWENSRIVLLENNEFGTDFMDVKPKEKQIDPMEEDSFDLDPSVDYFT